MPTEQGHGECTTCGATCCRYVTVAIDKPHARIDREEIRWFLAHENVCVYIDADDKSWNVQFHTDCLRLDKDGRCTIYANRYDICRDHDTGDCEASDAEATDTVFRTTGDFDAWWKKKRAKRRRKKDKARKAGKR